VPPSGEQVEIVRGDQRATIVEVGGGLRTYTVAGRDVLDGYAIGEMCSGGRGQVLLPWPNRIRDGRYEFDGRSLQLSMTEPSHQNAIHGLVRWASWTIAARETDRVVMEHLLHPQPGYPFSLESSIEYQLTAEGLRVRMTVKNVGSSRCPFGSGAHPYLSIGDDLIDDAILSSPGRTILRADRRGIPVGASVVAGTQHDLRQPRPIGKLKLDDAFTDLERDERGLAWVRLSAPDGRSEVSLWVDDAYRYLMLFTGDTLAGGGRRSLAVEPMTCAPDAFRSGDGLTILEAGSLFTGTWGITASSQ
jgi:aldose 1-epimerase